MEGLPPLSSITEGEQEPPSPLVARPKKKKVIRSIDTFRMEEPPSLTMQDE